VFTQQDTTHVFEEILLSCLLSSCMQIPLDGCPETHTHRRLHLRMKTPLPENNETHCRANSYQIKERKKKYTTQRKDLRNLQSSINIIKM